LLFAKAKHSFAQSAGVAAEEAVHRSLMALTKAKPKTDAGRKALAEYAASLAAPRAALGVAPCHDERRLTLTEPRPPRAHKSARGSPVR